MTPLAKFRQQYPGAYDDLSDEQLADALYRKFYSDMPRDQYNAKIGLARKPSVPFPGQEMPGGTLVTKPYEPDPQAAAFAPQLTAGELHGPEAQRQSLGERGIDVGSAPVGQRFRAGFARSPEEALRAQGLETMRDEPTGRTLYRASPGEPWKTFSQPGIPDVGDVASLVGPAIPFLGGVLGGVASVPAGGIVGAASVGAGTGAGEVARLSIGRRMGVVPESASIPWDAAVEGALAAVGAGIGTMGYAAFKAIKGRGMPQWLKDISPEDYATLQQHARARLQGAGISAPPRPSQVLATATPENMPSEQAAFAAKRAGDNIAAQEGDILQRGGESGRRLAENMYRQMDALEAQRAGIAGNAPVTTAEEVGTRAGAAIGKDIAKAKGDVDIAAKVAEQDLSKATRQFSDAINPKLVGDPLRARVDAAYRKAESDASAAFERAKKGTEGLSGPATNTVKALSDDEGAIAKNLLPKLTEEDAGLVRSGLERLASGQATVDEINTTLRAIRREVRRTHTGVATADVQQLMRLEDALVADRAAILGPQRAAMLQRAEQGWRDLRDDFQRAPLVGRALGRRTGGAEAIEDMSLGQAATKTDNIAAMARVFKRTGDREGLELLRKSLRYRARDASGLTSGEEINAAALQKWVDNNSAELSQVFTKAEIKNMFSAAIIKREAEKFRAIKADVEKWGADRAKSLGIDYTPMREVKDPASFADNLIGSNDAQRARSIVDILAKRDKGTLDELRAHARQRFADEIEFEKPLDERALRVYREILGPDIEGRAKRILDAVQLLRPTHLAGTVDAPGGGFRETMMRLQRVMFSPLSPVSRRTTLFRELSATEMKERVRRAFVDNDAMNDLLRAARYSKKTRTGFAVTGGALAPEGFDVQTEIDKWVPNGR